MGSGKTLTLLRFWGCSHMCNNNMMLQERAHSWHSPEFVCESLCQDRGEDKILKKKGKSCEIKAEWWKGRWGTGISEMWKRGRRREPASGRWHKRWLRGCERSRGENEKEEKVGTLAKSSTPSKQDSANTCLYAYTYYCICFDSKFTCGPNARKNMLAVTVRVAVFWHRSKLW